MAFQMADRAALWLARPLLLFVWVARPVIVTINFTGNGILRLAGFRPAGGEEMVHSVEELLLLIEDQEQPGILDPDQAELVENVFRLPNNHVPACTSPHPTTTPPPLSPPP